MQQIRVILIWRRISVDGVWQWSPQAYAATKVLCNLAAAVKPSVQDILDALVVNLERAPTLLERCRCVEVRAPLRARNRCAHSRRPAAA